MAERDRLGVLRDPRTLEAIGLLLIVLLAIVLRTYRMPELLVLHNDQGRDAMVVAQMMATRQPVLEGSVASIGTFHRGPAYYYLLAPAYALSLGHPIGGALLTVFLDIAALLMLALLARAIAGPVAGITAAALWAAAPIVVEFGSFQWNPQSMPFFLLLAIYAALKIGRGGERWLVVLVPSFLVAWQLHDPALFFGPLLAGVVLWRRHTFSRETVLSASVFGLFVLLPFLIQQLTHGLRDVVAMVQFALGAIAGSGRQPAVGPWLDRLVETWRGLQRALPPESVLGLVVLALAGAGLAWAIWRLLRRRSADAAIVCGIAATPLLFVFWPAPFHAHYLIAIYFVPLFLAGLGTAAVARLRPRLLVPAATLGVAAIVLTSAGSLLAERAQEEPSFFRWENRLAVAREIVQDSAGQPFEFVLESALEPLDGWQAPWQYALRYAGGTPDTMRTDIPRYFVFDPADWADGPRYGGRVRENVRWVRIGPAITGDCAAVAGWTFSGGGSGQGAATDAAPLRLANEWPWSSTDGSALVNLQPDRDYIVSFDYRTDLVTGAVFAFLQILDDDGRVVETRPTGAGLLASRSSQWQHVSFRAERAPGVAGGRLIMRGRGLGSASIKNVCVAEVVSDGTPD